MGKNNKDKRDKEEIKSKKKHKKMKTWKKVLIIFFLIILITGGVFAYKTYKNGGGLTGMLATAVGHDENTKKNLGEFRALILGISTDQAGVELTDTIMIASYNPNSQKATLLSIPRDTYTGKNTAKATAYEKINSLYSRKGNAEETLKAVNEITGLNIEYYAVIKTEALIKLVDVIGGVTFNVPINMDYDDPSQDLHIHLKKGEQLLDGDKAEQLVRFRHNNNYTSYPTEYGDNDLGRMRTQREFITQVLKQTLKAENILKIGQILDVAKEYVITNIDFNAAKDYIPYAVEFNTENLLTDTLPGTVPDLKKTNNVSIFVVDREATKEKIQELFYDRDLEQLYEETANTTDGENITNSNSNIPTSDNSNTVSKSDIKLEVLNGSGESNALQKAVKELEGAGYNVARTGSTNSTAKTAIINKKNAKETLLKNIKETLGTGTISNSTNSSAKVDVTVIIGKDY